MWIGLAILLLIVWGVLKLAVGVASFVVHLLIVLAVIAVIGHFISAARSRT